MPDQLSDEQLAEWEREADGLVTGLRAGRVDGLLTAVPLLVRALRDARDEKRNHELCNGGCIPGDAYRDLAHHHAEVERESTALRERLAAIQQLCDEDWHRAMPGYLLKTEVRAALAADPSRSPSIPVGQEPSQ